MAEEKTTPYVVPAETENSASAGILTKLTAWASENKVTAVVLAIVIIIAVLWYLTDKGYIENLPVSLPFKIGRKNPRGKAEESDEDSDEEEGELEEEIDDIINTQKDIWNEKVQKDDIIV